MVRIFLILATQKRLFSSVQTAVGNSLVNPKENLQRQDLKMLANDARNLLINILCTALYGCSWLLFLYSFLRVLLWIWT